MSESFNAKKVVRRRVVARNCIEATMPAPGTDLTIDLDTDSYTQLAQYPIVDWDFFSRGFEMEGQSSIVVRNIGVFSNFADGLVFAEPYQRFTAKIEIGTMYENTKALIGRNQLSGVLSVTPGSKTLSGSGGSLFTSQLSAGSIVICRQNTAFSNPDAEQVLVVDSVTNDTTATLRDYPRYGGSFFSCNLASFDTEYINTTNICDMGTLNCMNSLDLYFSGFSSSIPDTSQVTYGPFIKTTLKSGIDPNSKGEMTFHTDSVAAGFEGDKVFFDTVLDVDYTKKEVF